jgi:hypothetical protein
MFLQPPGNGPPRASITADASKKEKSDLAAVNERSMKARWVARMDARPRWTKARHPAEYPHPREKNGINASIQKIYVPNNPESGGAWDMGTAAYARRRLGRQGWGLGEPEEHCQASLLFAYASSLPTATPRRHELIRCQAKPTDRMDDLRIARHMSHASITCPDAAPDGQDRHEVTIRNSRIESAQ